MAVPEQRVTPSISVVIAVYNDWVPLDRCLNSLSLQGATPSFEVVIVDDGSLEPMPASLLNGSRTFPLTVVRQRHCGIPTARNRGAQAAAGKLLLFVDADCNLPADCLSRLASTVGANPDRKYFQLRLVGDCSTLVGRAEELRLLALQRHLLQPDGRIRYLNTAGFAMRSEPAEVARGLFDASALRAEDTLFLVTLMQRGELPFFVADAVVHHSIPLTLAECLRKDVRTVGLEARAYKIIRASGVSIRLTFKDRIGMLGLMWRASDNRAIGRTAWFVATGRQVWQRAVALNRR